MRIMAILGELLRAPVEAVKAAAFRPDPKRPRSIFIDNADGVGAQAVQVRRVALVGGEGIPIVSVQAIFCAKPHPAVRILQDTIDGDL